MKKCNEEIWSLNIGKMPHIRSNDKKIQSAENTYVKATLPIIRLAHSLVSVRENPTECKIDTEKALQDCTDSYKQLFSHNSTIFVEINLRPFCLISHVL